MLICGLTTSDTRQKAGRLAIAWLRGGVKGPAATDCAVMVATSFNFRAPSCSQGTFRLRPFSWPPANAVPVETAKVALKTISAMAAFVLDNVVICFLCFLAEGTHSWERCIRSDYERAGVCRSRPERDGYRGRRKAIE